MKQLIYYIVAILLFSPFWTAKAQEDKKNELLREFSKAPEDSTRLQVLFRLTQVTKYQPLIRLYYIDQLIKEADKQQNDFYKCRAYLYRIYIAYNQYDTIALHHWYSFLEPLAKKNNFHDILFQGKRCVIDFLQISGEYEKEESEALAMLKEAEKVESRMGMIVACQSLANAYTVTYRYKEAFAVLERAYQLSLDDKENVGTILEITNSLITIAEETKDKSNWLKYIQIEESYIENNIRNSQQTSFLGSFLFMMYVHYVFYYTANGGIEEAGRYYQLAKKVYYDSHESGVFQEYYMRASCVYFQQTKQYDQALLHSDTLLTLLRPVSMLMYNNALAEHAGILHAMGRDKEALKCYKQAKVGHDVSQLEVLNNQTEQVKNIHNIYLLQLKKDQSNYYLQLSILLFLIVSILIINGFIIYTYRTRRKLKRDEAIMRQMTSEVELVNVAKERFLSNISTSIRKPLDTVVDNSLLLASENVLADDERLRLSEAISITSSDLMRLINDILDLSRLEAGMMRFVKSDIEVFSLIHDVAARVGIEQGQEMNIVCPQSALFWTHTDGAWLMRVFNALCSSMLPGKELQVSIEVNEGGTELLIKVYSTLLAKCDLSQHLIIRNEINRMVIEAFNGVYENRVDAQTPYVYFTIKGNLMQVE